MKVNWKKLSIAVIGTQLAGGLGALATTPNIPTWYASLNKPFFNPPNWIFGPVWTLLYLLMAIAAYLIWNTKKSDKRDQALQAYLLQLALNTTWSLIFFGAQNPTYALGEILILLSSIIFTTKLFKKINPTAAYLMYPYIAWVSFATVLNTAIAYLN